MSARAAAPKPHSQAEDDRDDVLGVGMIAPFAAQAVRAALLGLNAAEALLQGSRKLVDASRTMIRGQQDAFIRAWWTQLAEASGEQRPIAMDRNAEALFAPALAAARNWAQMGDIVLRVQRGALETLSQKLQ